MFDFAWSEFAVIAVVALICIGPKDMPVAIRAAAGWIKKARRMASEFQTHVDEMVREANLQEVRDHISDLRSLNVAGAIERMVDTDGSIRRTFTENPLNPSPARTAEVTGAAFEELAAGDVAVAERPAAGPAESLPEPIMAGPDPLPSPSNWLEDEPLVRSSGELPREAPAFIPPGAAVPPRGVIATPEPPALVPPAFIPPEIATRLTPGP